MPHERPIGFLARAWSGVKRSVLSRDDKAQDQEAVKRGRAIDSLTHHEGWEYTQAYLRDRYNAAVKSWMNGRGDKEDDEQNRGRARELSELFDWLGAQTQEGKEAEERLNG